ncbi:tyrosine-type recombinase/integrase [Clostridium brassicae]|uniref:Site-specific integrase n=1 Tax=Clostridium brassicae TaxID=2999072 RepID=A0ABT4D942_9CLOT|nr:site-specific integrase [Clostridium brassicae]MCY6958828.1 site-specific integrase [Clostridium brassicae]
MKGTVRKEGSTWSYFVYVGIDENNKKKYKRKRGFKTKKECEAALAETITQIEKGTILANDKMTTKEYMQYWMETYPKNNCSPSTYKRYEFFIRDITKYIGKYKLSKLNPMIIQKFYEKLISDRKISNNTVIKTHRMLHLSLKHAQQWQLIHTNPCDLVTPPKSTKKEMKYWQPDEINFYLETIDKTEFLYAPILLAIHTGLRVGELCALKWEDIDFINGTMRVNKTLQRINGKLSLKEPKTKNSSRIVTLLNTTITFLNGLKKEALQRKLKYGINLDYVLCWADGRPIDPHYISQHFPKLLEKYNLPKIRFHDLRHTHATLLLKLGTNPKVISERLGHSTVSFTLDTYSHVNTDMQRNEVSKAENFL